MMERHLTGLESLRFPSPYSRDDFSLLEKEVARLQAEVTREMAASLWRGIRKTASAVARFFALIARAGAASRLYDELNRMDDATLANLGLSREAIPQYVQASMEDGAGRWPTAAVPAAALQTVDGRSDAAVADNDLGQCRAA
jgi:uncharacterized protein YjiS (DUF1127 family)